MYATMYDLSSLIVSSPDGNTPLLASVEASFFVS